MSNIVSLDAFKASKEEKRLAEEVAIASFENTCPKADKDRDDRRMSNAFPGEFSIDHITSHILSIRQDAHKTGVEITSMYVDWNETGISLMVEAADQESIIRLCYYRKVRLAKARIAAGQER